MTIYEREYQQGETLSPRDTLLSVLVEGCQCETCVTEANAQIDRFAHELAEKIREDVGPRDCRCNGLCGDCYARSARLADADLIDPEVP